MNESLPESDDQLALQKRARRRLIGAIVFVTFAAVVLPMVMDEEAPPATPSIELNIPQQEKGFVAPPTGIAKSPATVAESVPALAAVVAPPAVAAIPEAKPAAVVPAAPAAAAIPAAKPAEPKASSKPPAKPLVKTPAKPEAKPADAKRAQALLEGKAAEAAAGADAPHVVLIGAFSNPGNVQTLQKKLGELGLKVYTEPLDTPQGKKTRVRAGPFASREAAEKAVARMKSIGVGGVVAPRS